MAKFTRSQVKGKNSSYTCRFKKKLLSISKYSELPENLEISSFVRHPLTGTPLMVFKKGNLESYFPAFRGATRGMVINNRVKPLSEFQEGDVICCVENKSGKLMLTSPGTKAVVFGIKKDQVVLKLNKRLLKLNPKSKALEGVVGGADRDYKPIVTAGTNSKIFRAKGKKYPTVSAHKMNVNESLQGGSNRKTRGRPMTTSKNKSPGAKFGSIGASRTGRKK